MTSSNGKLAADAILGALHAEDKTPESVALATVALALLDVAEAIREASKPADEEPKVRGSRDW